MEPIVVGTGWMIPLLLGLALLVMVVGTLEMWATPSFWERDDWYAWKALEVSKPSLQWDTEAWTDFTVWKTRYAAPRRFQWGRAFLAAVVLWPLVGLRSWFATPSMPLVGLALVFPLWSGWYRPVREDWFARIGWEIWRRSRKAQHAPRQTRDSVIVWDYLRRKGQL